MKYIPKTLVYTTPFLQVWKMYCDAFIHSLICIDHKEDVGIVVYS